MSENRASDPSRRYYDNTQGDAEKEFPKINVPFLMAVGEMSKFITEGSNGAHVGADAVARLQELATNIATAASAGTDEQRQKATQYKTEIDTILAEKRFAGQLDNPITATAFFTYLGSRV